MCRPCRGLPTPSFLLQRTTLGGQPWVKGQMDCFGIAAHPKESPGWLALRTGPREELFFFLPVAVTFSVGVCCVLLGASSWAQSGKRTVQCVCCIGM